MKILNLDCTMRDGGMLLEFNKSIGIPYEVFSEQDKFNFVHEVKKSMVDIIELGILDNDGEIGFNYYADMNTVSMLVPKEKNDTIFSILINGPKYPLDMIPNSSETNIDLIRFVIVYSQFEESLLYCKKLVDKGYKISIQPALTSQFSKDELLAIITLSNDIGAYSLYIVDTFGNLTFDEIKEISKYFNRYMDINTKLGIHLHNNNGMSISNALLFINEYKHFRDVIVDTCVNGMGLGAGNLQTELLHSVGLNFYDLDSFKSILSAAEVINKFSLSSPWGYSIESLISAKLNCSFKYSIQLRKQYNFDYNDIFQILSILDVNKRHIYDKKYLDKLVRVGAYKK